ncbi:MAG TPA: VWA domain-containing protein [Pyrinomonadaceae bacterium]|nr:VWA domain-containing protein [Pyrinomonadaceae bacterium]
MAKLPALALFFIASTATGYAQSGRRVEPAPSPPPSVANDPAEYSESRPARRRPLGPTVLRARAASANAAVGTQPQVQATPANDEDVLRVETDLITVPVSVFDRSGLYVANLRRSDFRIFEDGIEQEIAYFGTEDKPFTVVLLLDTSLSTTYKIEEIRQAAMAFVDQLRMQDSVMVIDFNRNIKVRTEVTNDRSRIFRAIQKANFGSGTSLYDAVDFTLRRRLDAIPGRKAIVLFTDGVDTTSRRAGYDSTLSLAEEADAMIFPIYYNTFAWNRPRLGFPEIYSQIGTRPEDYALGRKYLDEISEYTGGRVFRPESTPGGLAAAFEGIAEELRRQYNIGYIPAKRGNPGERKLITVRVNRPNLNVRARDSYIVGDSNPKQ